jgi:carbonic anhydrase
MRLPVLESWQHILRAAEFGTKSQLLAEIGENDDPIAVMLTCSELGFAPDHISHANPGEIMIVQNLAGVVPPSDTGGTFASIMYSLHLPTVRHLIVCGHTKCGILRMVLANEAKGKKSPFSMGLQGLSKRFHAIYSDRPEHDWLGIIVQETILQQLAHFRSDTYIQSRLQQSKLCLHGWIRDDQTSSITAYEPVLGQFCD